MKVKTSVTLSRDLLQIVDRRARQYKKNRSEVIETAVRSFLEQVARAEQNAKDFAVINEQADGLNKEALEILAYQVQL